MAPPKIGVAYSFLTVLIDAANRPALKPAPTIVAGDFQVSTDGSGFANLATLPAASPAGSEAVKVTLSAGEMTGSLIAVRAIDQAGGEWDPLLAYVEPTVQTINDVPTSADNADRLLGRNLAGGADGGRTVRQALRALRNLREIIAGVFTVFREDDVTPDWTAAVTTTPGDPVNKIDPT